MSTFNGQIEEISGIAVDEFSEENIHENTKALFVSHCHSDHMHGLAELKNFEYPIYATSISALFIRTKFPNLKENIKELEIGFPTAIDIQLSDDEKISFVVTCLSAGHCPGSCMFLFETDTKAILYTGDFRTSLKNLGNIKQFKELRDHDNVVIYMDSTFFKKSFSKFPTQTESVQKIIELVDNWIKKSNHHKVHLNVPARYGYEYLLMELYRTLEHRIYIPEDKVYEQYLTISNLDNCVTNDGLKSQIILAPKYLSNIPEKQKTDLVLKLQLSAWFWTNWNEKKPFVSLINANNVRVCYATHSSYDELKAFLVLLKPIKVFLNVVPTNSDEKREMINELQDIQDLYIDKPKEEITTNRSCFKRLLSDLSQNSKEPLKRPKEPTNSLLQSILDDSF
ncbi:unnamed protein product [Diamesa serratosioi]